MYKAKDLRDQSLAELEAAELDTRRRLYDLNNQFKAHKKRENPHELRHARKDLSRLLTILTEKRNQEKQNVEDGHGARRKRKP